VAVDAAVWLSPPLVVLQTDADGTTTISVVRPWDVRAMSQRAALSVRAISQRSALCRTRVAVSLSPLPRASQHLHCTLVCSPSHIPVLCVRVKCCLNSDWSAVRLSTPSRSLIGRHKRVSSVRCGGIPLYRVCEPILCSTNFFCI